ncbi:MAG: hypothetical protein JXR07_07365 [Reichenbachiella sp.]
MTKISFDFLGMTLLEPMALILNWLLCAQALLYFSKLNSANSSPFLKYWRAFFLFFAVSTFLGGLSHLFFGYLGILGKIPGWIAAVVAISCIEMAVASKAENSGTLRVIIQGKFITTLLLLLLDFSFKWVMVHTGIGLVAILGTASAIGIFKGQNHLWFFIMAILAMTLALPFRLMDINLHLWFNRDDVGHTFMMITLFLFYRGIIETLEDSLVIKPLS